MEVIFHEQQDGSLCAQHCLNSLLQDQVYSAMDLAELARELDVAERDQIALAGDNLEYRRFIQEPSHNMDDTGFFSVQVIERALSFWDLTLTPFTSLDPLAVRARSSPISANAYICNYQEHWFTIRRLGHQWFNLNSLLEGPELVSNSSLGEFLSQLQQEGYSIFIVQGQLPECDADLVLQAVTAKQTERPRRLSEQEKEKQGLQSAIPTQIPSPIRDEEADIEAALMLSLAENTPGPSGGPAVIDNEELQRALGRGVSIGSDSEERELELALQLSSSGFHNQPSEEDELQQAISSSLSCLPRSTASSQPTAGVFGGGPGGLSVPGGWGSRLEQQEVAEEEKYKDELLKQKEEEEEELRKAMEMSLQVDPKTPAQNIAGVPKHLKTKPSSNRMDSDKSKSPSKASSQDNSVLASTQAANRLFGAGVPRPTASAANSLYGAAASSLQGTTAGTHSLPGRAAASKSLAETDAVTNALSGSAAANSLQGRAAATNRLAATAVAIPNDGGHSLGGRRTRQPDEPDPAEIRRRRLAFLDKMQK